jgi:hypothetical protein
MARNSADYNSNQGWLSAFQGLLLGGAIAMSASAYVGSGTSVEGFIVGFLSSDPRVEQVLVSRDEGALHIWTIVNRLPQSDVRQLYGLEGKLLDRFPHAPIDFHIIDRRDAPADNLVPGARQLLQPVA